MFKTDEEVSSSLGLIETSNTLGKVLSPILGAFLAGFFWFIPFFSIPIFCLLSILLMLFLVKTPNKRQEPIPFKTVFGEYKGYFQKQLEMALCRFYYWDYSHVCAICCFILFIGYVGKSI